jgi:hypothetical protein
LIFSKNLQLESVSLVTSPKPQGAILQQNPEPTQGLAPGYSGSGL